jgi:hypothetical protein
VELLGKTFGEVVAQEILASTPVVKVLRGIEGGSKLPVFVFVFDRDLESLAAQRWVELRALRSRAPVTEIAIIDAQQTADLFFVSVAWNPQSTSNMGTLPQKLFQILAWLESSSRDDLGVRVTDVLRAIENLEPRAVARTVMLEPDRVHAPPVSSSDSLRATSILRPSPPRRTTTLTASPVELREFASTKPSAPSSQKWWLWGAAMGVAAAAVVGIRGLHRVTVTNSTHGAEAALFLPPVAAQQPRGLHQVIPPQDPPPVSEIPTEERPAVVEPSAQDQSPTEQTVVVSSRPSGATVCDPKTGKILGKTPLNLRSSQFAAGYKLLLTRVGSQFRTFRWPADHPMTLSRLDTDETQPLSPCAF